MFQNGCAGIPAKLLTMRTSEDSSFIDISNIYGSSTFMPFDNTDRSHVVNKELAHARYWNVF